MLSEVLEGDGFDAGDRLVAIVDRDLEGDRSHAVADGMHLDQGEAVHGGGDLVRATEDLDCHLARFGLLADRLVLTCLTVMIGTTISCNMAPPCTKRAPPVK